VSRAHDRFAAACVALVAALEVAFGLDPAADRLTWSLENFPVWIGIAAWLLTRKRFQLSRLCLVLFSIHAVILMVGGYATYARAAPGEWLRAAFELERNPYDRIGHLAQGFVPAIFVRELLTRVARVPRSKWRPVLVVCACLAFSAFYELIEWWAALLHGEAATDFLGTQGDVWDTQWDMFLALVGALASLALLGRVHDRSMAAIEQPGEQPDEPPREPRELAHVAADTSPSGRHRTSATASENPAMKTDVSFLNGQKIEVYSATWCPDCRRLDRWLELNGVPHAKVDIDTTGGAAEELEESTGKRGVPYLKLNGAKWVRGYHKELPARFDPALLVRELQQALAKQE
jgi:putative membrane protein